MVDYRDIIKRKRIELGLSQNQLAKLVGITQPFMNEIENGRKAPSVDVLFKICEQLEIPIFGERNT
jgi:transcriptional regulator with XRE-family HTH domain